MNHALKTYIEHYVALETGIQEWVLKKCQSLCAQCTAICCDVVMCEEAIKSPFLKLVHQQTDQFDKETGFLSNSGCRLKIGRPSVCYGYFCDNHFYYQPDDLHAHILQILGALLHHAIQNAKDGIPLDEILSETELENIDFQTLEKQLQESVKALEIIRSFYQDGTLSAASLLILKRIRIPEEFDSPPEASGI